jgi:hypothetical protein
MLWPDASMEVYWPTKGLQTGRCQVRIDNGMIIVSYREDGGLISYSGEEEAPGHFKLTCSTHPEKKGRGTLHRFPDDDYVEGYWIETLSDGRVQGMWRIFLGDPR